MTLCPCGSSSAYADCCQPIIEGQRAAENAEELIRARYTAHTVTNMGFILKTHHPSSRTDIDEVATAKWAGESEWLGLNIIDIDEAEPNTTRIEFTASYRDVNKQRHTHHELGIFEKYNGQWFFKDAEVPEVRQFRRTAPKQGRNDPCACGSGKKHKKCCGAAA